MPSDDKNQGVFINGRIFQRVKMGLDEKEVLPFIRTIIEQRDELAKRQENSPTLTRFIEKIAREADAWAEQTKKEAREQACTDTKAILLKAEEQARHYIEEKRIEANEQVATESNAIIKNAEEQANKYIEEKRNETIAVSRKEAEFLKNQAQIQVEAWVKEIKDNLIIQLRGIGGLLNKEMRSQAEDLKRRAAAFESDLEKQLMDIKNREITIYTESSAENQTKSSSESAHVSGQKTAPGTQKEATVTPNAFNKIVEETPKETKWVEIHIAAGDEDEIKAFKFRLDQQSEIGASLVNKEIDRTFISVFLRKPIDLKKKLMSLPEVKQAQEIMENEQIMYKVVLAQVTPKENMKDNLREQLRNLHIQS